MVFQRNSIQSPGGRTLPGVEFVIALSFLFVFSGNVIAQVTPSPFPSVTVTPTVEITVSPTATTTVAPNSATETAPSVIPASADTPTLPPPTPTPTIIIQNTTSTSTQALISSSSAALNTATVVNTNSSGSLPTVINYTQPTTGTVDLSASGSCDASASAALASIINNANITNTIDVNSVTGGQTAGATANVFNMANTTLSGSCWNFMVVNFFSKHNGNIIIPPYQTFVKPTASAMKVAAASPTVTNTVDVNNILNAQANTGMAGSTDIVTGNAVARIQAQNVLNTTILGNNWLFLTVRSFGGWNGSLLNWPGSFVQTPDYTYAFLPLSGTAAESPVPVTNHASLTNIISATADSAYYAMPSGQTNTGAASAAINLFNLVNTTISGNNWYFAYLTFFDSFNGNILFPSIGVPITITPSAAPVPQSKTTPTDFVSNMHPSATGIPAMAVTPANTHLSALKTVEIPPTERAGKIMGANSKKGIPPPVSGTSSSTLPLFFSSAALLAASIKEYVILRKMGV